MSLELVGITDPDQHSHLTIKIENTEKRDVLQATEKKYQKLWQDERVFEADAPSCSEYPPGSMSHEELRARVPKFLSNDTGHPFLQFRLTLARNNGISVKENLYLQMAIS
ncbi:hypothetical protein EJ05DRAFT_504337 [Pseudovirgaria hyperparasitica]|uniref:Uncharacterized protein n=1 Tax=Pseudovirgaria hyperparasitica TaxID=470096 RepID=A0A6A6VU70_9PEZI|nr:uncharacterized protein EJ05DRAFT_504337 [Pseudovirgaria hyperparasitica]KAF2754238.1 hypothetical protein EJ05DRAFT_504337 [Pseudovirgaria hyperparasitica]